MAYKANEKKYTVKVYEEKHMTIEELIVPLCKEYMKMCEYHEKKVTDIKHIQNYIRKSISFSLPKADVEYLLEHCDPYSSGSESQNKS